MITLEHVHAASKVVIDSGSVDGIATKARLTDLSGLEEAAKSPSWLINVVEHGAQATERERLVWMIVVEGNIGDCIHVA